MTTNNAINNIQINQINGDSGSIAPTGGVVTIKAGNSSQNSGATVTFTNSSSTSTLNVSDANSNTLIGNLCGAGISVGDHNTGLGTCLGNLNGGIKNTAIGYAAGQSISAGGSNTCVGYVAGNSFTTGSNNVVIGQNAATTYSSSESSNIIISNAGTNAESNTIKIGTQGSGSGQQNKCFIAGINGVTASSPNYVTINTSTNQLGVAAIPTAFAWTDVTGATQTLAANNGYVTDRSGGVTYTLPASGTLGDNIQIVGKLGLATITPNALQQIVLGAANGTAGITGTAVATNLGDCIELTCITAGSSTVWRARNWVGAWTLT